MYGDAWAEVNPEADDSACLHPDGHIVIARKEMDASKCCSRPDINRITLSGQPCLIPVKNVGDAS